MKLFLICILMFSFFGTSESLAQEFDFEIWPERSILSQGSKINLSGSICPSPTETFDLQSFYHAESDEDMNAGGFLTMHYLQKPDGTVESQMRNYYEEYKCGDSTPQYFYADQIGEYTVYAQAVWNHNNITKITSNTVTITATKPLFDYVIEPVHVEKKDWVLHMPLDWSSDGKYILFAIWKNFETEERFRSLVLVSPDGLVHKELVIKDSIITGIDHALISPTNEMVHILDNGKIYRYVLETDEIVQLDTEDNNVQFFDYYHYGEDEYSNYSIVYSVENTEFYADDPSSQYSLLIMGDVEQGIGTPNEFFSKIEHPIFHFSPDGKKILFMKTIDAGYGWADRVPAYIGAQEYGPHVIENVELNCSHHMEWSPNGQMIVYQDNSCGRTDESGMIGLATLDGYTEQLIPKIKPATRSYPSVFVISPDGAFIVFLTSDRKSDYGGDADFYKMILAKPIPEFGTISVLILMMLGISVVLFSKLKNPNFRLQE